MAYVEVLNAWYGTEQTHTERCGDGMPIAERIRRNMKNGSIHIPGNMNNFFGVDPIYGQVKCCAVHVRVNGQEQHLRAAENMDFWFPQPGAYSAPPPQQQQMRPPMGATGAAVDPDPGRHESCRPGRLLYSAKLNRDILNCYYRCRCYCCPGAVTTRTYLDIYSNGVRMNVPSACLCCIWRDNARVLHYDDVVFSFAPEKGGCCTPYPYFCPHCCNYCGETLIFRSGCCGCPSNFAHGAAAMGLFCPIDVVMGLEEGEGEVVQQQLEAALEQFRNGRAEIVLPANTKMMR